VNELKNMDSRNFAIGLLSTTATILLVGVVLLYSRPNQVLAEGMTVSGGGYIVTVGSLTRNDEEVVYIMDTATDKMLVYRFDTQRSQIEILQGIDLAELRQDTAATPGGQPPPASNRPRTRQP